MSHQSLRPVCDPAKINLSRNRNQVTSIWLTDSGAQISIGLAVTDIGCEWFRPFKAVLRERAGSGTRSTTKLQTSPTEGLGHGNLRDLKIPWGIRRKARIRDHQVIFETTVLKKESTRLGRGPQQPGTAVAAINCNTLSSEHRPQWRYGV